jgi:leucine dehydrogenase
MLLDFGDLVESLDGRYITAEDVGTSADDMAVIGERTRHVTGMPLEMGGAGDPSPYTALGVEAAIRATCRRAFGSRLLAGRSVAVVGVGHVGARLARALAGYGVELTLADINPDARSVAEELGARWLDPERALVEECDVLAPCAVGGVLHPDNVDRLRCRVVCGAANNQLADDSLAERLAERGILYAPDFIVNAGGLISVYRELKDYDADHAYELALGIEETMGRILEEADARGITPLAAAHELARSRLDAAVR